MKVLYGKTDGIFFMGDVPCLMTRGSIYSTWRIPILWEDSLDDLESGSFSKIEGTMDSHRVFGRFTGR